MLFRRSDRWHSLGLSIHPALGKILAQSSREGARETNAGLIRSGTKDQGPECKGSQMCCPLLPPDEGKESEVRKVPFHLQMACLPPKVESLL